MIFTIIDGSSNPYVAAPLGGNMTARPVGPLGSSDRHHVFNIPHPSPTLRCPSGEHPSGHQCVSNITNRPIPCPLNQHVTPQGICVSNITNRQISCSAGQRVTVNGICIPSHAPATIRTCPYSSQHLTSTGRCI